MSIYFVALVIGLVVVFFVVVFVSKIETNNMGTNDCKVDQRVYRDISIALIIVVGLILLFFLCFPKTITGDYADITVLSAKVEPTGVAEVSISLSISPDTRIQTAGYNGTSFRVWGIDKTGWGMEGFGSTPPSTSVNSILLNPESMHPGGHVAPAHWADRLLVRAGDKQQIRRGDRFYLCNFHDTDGTLHSYFIEILLP